MPYNSKIQANNINNKKSYLLGQYYSKQGTHYVLAKDKISKIWKNAADQI